MSLLCFLLIKLVMLLLQGSNVFDQGVSSSSGVVCGRGGFRGQLLQLRFSLYRLGHLWQPPTAASAVGLSCPRSQSPLLRTF